MLVLSRKENQSIVISDHIVVTVLDIRGDSVRLGIEAPREVTIHRREIHEKIQATEESRSAGMDFQPAKANNY